jgi:hypothetical protein
MCVCVCVCVCVENGVRFKIDVHIPPHVHFSFRSCGYLSTC